MFQNVCYCIVARHIWHKVHSACPVDGAGNRRERNESRHMMESQSTPTISNGSGLRAYSRLADGLPEGEMSAIDAKQVIPISSWR